MVKLCQQHRRGAAWIGREVGLAASTVQKILNKAGLGHLRRGDSATRTPPMRYVSERPGELVHIDVKKLASILDGGGWRIHGRGNTGRRQRVGYVYIHSAVDDHSRVAYSEILTDETGRTAAEFYKRAHTWFAERGIAIKRVLTDNGGCYRSRQWRQDMRTTDTCHKRTRPYRPQTNGKVERFHRTLLEEWVYIRNRTSQKQRTTAYKGFYTTTINTEPTAHSKATIPASTIGYNPCETHS